MPFDCPVPGCRQSYLSSAPLRSHLAQASDKPHQKYHEDLYTALDFDVSTSFSLTLPSQTLAQSASFHYASSHHAPGEEEGEEEDAEEVSALDDPEVPEVLDSVEDQLERELVVEIVDEEEELDAVAEAMDGLRQKFQLTSEEELAEYLGVPDVGEGVGDKEGETFPEPLHRKLMEPPDARVTDWHPTAGKVEFLDQTALERWTKLWGNQRDDSYKPFLSQIDWELAHWAVKEKIPQGSLDRLLRIPQVSFYFF